MPSKQRWDRVLILMAALPLGCAGGNPGLPPAPVDLGRMDRLAFYSAWQVLNRADVREAAVTAICLGMGEDGSEVPPAAFLRGFSDFIPPVRARSACLHSEGGTIEDSQVLTLEGDPALILSVLEVVPVPGSASVRIQLESSGRAPREFECRIRETAQRVPIGRGPPQASSGSRVSVLGC